MKFMCCTTQFWVFRLPGPSQQGPNCFGIFGEYYVVYALTSTHRNVNIEFFIEQRASALHVSPKWPTGCAAGSASTGLVSMDLS